MRIDLFHIDEAFRDYITNRLLSRLGLTIGDCTMEVPLSGKKSCIRLVKHREGKGYAVRAFPKQRTREAFYLYSADDLLDRNKIPAPRLVDYAENYSTQGVTFVAEEYLEGKNWGDLEVTEDLARRLGSLLSRLHSVASDQWGPITPEESSRGTFGASQFRRVKHRLYRVKKFAPDTLSASEFRAVREWFRALMPSLDGIRSFQLIHDKINRGNVYCHPGKNELFFLDFATLQYGCRGKDLAQAECDLLENKKDLIKIFMEEYFSHFSRETREQYERLATFYHAYYHLSRSAVNLRRDHVNRTQRHIFKSNHYDQFLTHWRTLWTFIEGVSDATPVQAHGSTP